MPSSPKIKPCPFCGGECVVIDWELTCTVDCVAGECVYAAGHASSESEAIAAHNRVAGAAAKHAEAHALLYAVVVPPMGTPKDWKDRQMAWLRDGCEHEFDPGRAALMDDDGMHEVCGKCRSIILTKTRAEMLEGGKS